MNSKLFFLPVILYLCHVLRNFFLMFWIKLGLFERIPRTWTLIQFITKFSIYYSIFTLYGSLERNNLVPMCTLYLMSEYINELLKVLQEIYVSITKIKLHLNDVFFLIMLHEMNNFLYKKTHEVFLLYIWEKCYVFVL